jgi:hypothetical protein
MEWPKAGRLPGQDDLGPEDHDADVGSSGRDLWFWERLAANVGILLVFGAFYFRFLRR